MEGNTSVFEKISHRRCFYRLNFSQVESTVRFSRNNSSNRSIDDFLRLADNPFYKVSALSRSFLEAIRRNMNERFAQQSVRISRAKKEEFPWNVRKARVRSQCNL